MYILYLFLFCEHNIIPFYQFYLCIIEPGSLLWLCSVEVFKFKRLIFIISEYFTTLLNLHHDCYLMGEILPTSGILLYNGIWCNFLANVYTKFFV